MLLYNCFLDTVHWDKCLKNLYIHWLISGCCLKCASLHPVCLLLLISSVRKFEWIDKCYMNIRCHEKLFGFSVLLSRVQMNGQKKVV